MSFNAIVKPGHKQVIVLNKSFIFPISTSECVKNSSLAFQVTWVPVSFFTSKTPVLRDSNTPSLNLIVSYLPSPFNYLIL